MPRPTESDAAAADGGRDRSAENPLGGGSGIGTAEEGDTPGPLTMPGGGAISTPAGGGATPVEPGTTGTGGDGMTGGGTPRPG
jgi:hypothetical protein